MFGQIIIVLLLFAVVAVLVSGIVLMGIGGKTNAKYANKLMSLRVILQGLALLALALLFLVGNK